ncbi:hypothetical protein R1flu_007896 [Riccia fluitans]|uniref:Uncharacterized protein n=1 Tax=Riccia fluitans TaxID=41844 RepID=A0ABD1Z376_9MARC
MSFLGERSDCNLGFSYSPVVSFLSGFIQRRPKKADFLPIRNMGARCTIAASLHRGGIFTHIQLPQLTPKFEDNAMFQSSI